MATTLAMIVIPAKVIAHRAILSCRFTLRIKDLSIVCTVKSLLKQFELLVDYFYGQRAKTVLDDDFLPLFGENEF